MAKEIDAKKKALRGLISHMGGLALKKRKPDLAIYIGGAPHGADAYSEEGPAEESDENMNSQEAIDNHQTGKVSEVSEKYDEDGEDDPLIKRIKDMRRSSRKA